MRAIPSPLFPSFPIIPHFTPSNPFNLSALYINQPTQHMSKIYKTAVTFALTPEILAGLGRGVEVTPINGPLANKLLESNPRQHTINDFFEQHNDGVWSNAVFIHKTPSSPIYYLVTPL